MTARGVLRVYLGAAPGVGKTFAMLDEGHRRQGRGTDVVVGFVETHDRAHTAEKLDGLEVVPRRTVRYRGSTFTEMDLDAVLARHPTVALVDELAHTNVPGSGRHEKRWQDVEELLEAGIDVITTVNVQHLASLNDVVEQITGIPQQETVPDSVVRAADQVELVDMAPEALRRRMAHGNIYRAEKVDAALGNYFRVGNLTALRELALLWLADSVDEGLQRYRDQHGISEVWETRERVVVAVTGGPEGETLIRRAARIAARSTGGELLALHIARSDGLVGASATALSEQRQLVESLGGSYHSVVGDDVPRALLEFARGVNATQIVLGVSRRRPLLAALAGPGTGATVTRQSGAIDVHMVTHDYAGKGRRLPSLIGGLTPRRRLAGLVAGAVALAVLTPMCTSLRGRLTVGSDLLLYLTVVVGVSLLGGVYPALATAIAASLLINWYFFPPIHTWTISDSDNVLALVVFLVVALAVSRVVDLAARRTSQAARANAEADTIATLAASLLGGEGALSALLERVRETFAVDGVSLLRRAHEAPASDASGSATGLRGRWQVLACTGGAPCARPEDAQTEVAVGDDLVLALTGRPLPAQDRRILAAFASNVAVAYRQRELAEAAEAAAPLAASDRLRAALLSAVSHDLRTPLAAAKTAISGLRSHDVSWDAAQEAELLATADGAIDRVTALVTSLLDLSRVQAGALPVLLAPTGLDEVVALALADVAADRSIELDVPPALPAVLADAGLLERVVANLVENALRYGPAESRVRVAASSHSDRVQLRVADHGPGIPVAEREAVFMPFHRAGDRPAGGAGVGLGLAIARGMTEAMQGTVTVEDTPGGGATFVVDLPAAEPTRVTTSMAAT